MRVYLSQIREWVVDFSADMLFISLRTDVAWYRLSKYASPFLLVYLQPLPLQPSDTCAGAFRVTASALHAIAVLLAAPCQWPMPVLRMKHWVLCAGRQRSTRAGSTRC